jgi:DNA-binding GntR family transcriptional regulator
MPLFRTIEEHIHEELRDRIIAGRLPPLAQLGLAELADEFGVSTMPVRAALSRLEAEGLILQRRRRRSVVAPLNLNDFEDIQAMRAGIEAFAARLGAAAITEEGLARMRSLLRDVLAAQDRGDVDSYISLAWDLHWTCYSASGRERLLGRVEDVRRRADRYIRLAVGTNPRLGNAGLYQSRLVDACASHDGARAETVVRDALRWTIELVMPALAVSAGEAGSVGTP